MEALERFKKKLEDLAWNEMLYRTPRDEFDVEYKIVYCGNGYYTIRKYKYNKEVISWLLKPSRLKPPCYMVRCVLRELDEFEPKIVNIT